MFDRFLDFFFGKLLSFFTKGTQLSLLEGGGCYYDRLGGGRFIKKCLGKSIPEIAAIEHSFSWWSILMSVIQWLVMLFLWVMIIGFLVYAIISLIMWLTSEDWRDGVKKGVRIGVLKAVYSSALISFLYSGSIMFWFIKPIANPIYHSSEVMKLERYYPMFADWLSWKVAVFSPKLYVYLETLTLKLSLAWWVFTAGQTLPTLALSGGI